MNAESGNEQDEENIKTPKKMLFQSDEEDGDEKCKAGDCKEDRIADAKTGELKKLSEIYNEDAPKQWDKSKPQKRLKSASAASTLPAVSSAATCPDQDDSQGPKKPAAKRASRKKDAKNQSKSCRPLPRMSPSVARRLLARMRHASCRVALRPVHKFKAFAFNT